MQSNKLQKGITLTSLKATTVSLLLTFTTYIGTGAAQSLDQNKPAPLNPGLNSSVADSFIGSHFYYFLAGPGDIKVTVNFSSMGLLGNPTKATIGVYIYDEKGNELVHKNVTSNGASEQLILPGSLKRKIKLTLRIQPPPQGLLRSGGNYDVQVTGAVQYDTNAPSEKQDPIVRTYQFMSGVTGLFEGGAARFYSNGTLKLADGNTGTWELFDPEAKIYVVKIKGYIYNLKLRPGIGLVDTSDVSSIIFMEVR
ncbi:hypothetical protein N0Y54_25690 [Nostoc punctiforme UO1]|uniref:hypothetical protein n=1 Tax=Nostoc punctiforme TaxID=272131 RepID=UPI0030A3CC81